MWNDINAREYPKDNMKWIGEGMTEGSLIWTTDRSYNRKRAADLLGVGWIIFCKTTGRRIMGFFWEQLSTASSFFTEMLGLCTLHLFAQAISDYYDVQNWTALLCCNNKHALMLSSHHRGCIRLSAKCADIRRNFCATKQTYQGRFKYVHVYGHMDQHLSWTQLSLTQQLNCICNTLAKKL
jgi:hypothetical protein